MFRVRRKLELIWAVVFIANVAAWQLSGRFAWGNVVLAQTPVTVALVAMELASSRYHGVGWAWINPSRDTDPVGETR